MTELTTNVSWIAVIAGAVVSFLAGWLWYSPMLFGPKWAKGLGIEMGTANDMPFGAMASQMIGLLLMSWFVAVTAANNLLLTVILATIAFTILAYSGGMFAKQNAYVRNVNAGYWIISLVIMILANAIF